MLALTMGDPAGIGGELTTQMLDNPGIPFVVLDDPARLAALGMAKIVEVGSVREARSIFPRAIPVLPVFLQVPARPGQPDPTNAPAIIESITRATRLALSGEVGGIVTNPISKSTLYQAGFGYPGHTEFLAALTAAPTAIMMLVAPALRVVPVTVHVALRDVINTLTTQAILQAARITAIALRQDFNIADPRLAISGLNPHAGESGGLGDEENTLITPAIDQLRREGWNVSGPWPADTMFTPQARAGYDVAICMYHDQALIPLKTLDRDNGVNVTLGLPIIRTSPDHGTAFDIAGKGRADPSSLRAAMRLAAQMAEARATSPLND